MTNFGAQYGRVAALQHKGPQSLADLLGAQPVVGGPAGGRPVVTAAPAAAPSSLASLAGKHLNAVQQQRRALRMQELVAMGFDPNTAVYGPHANLAALRALQGGSGLGRGLGLARGR